MDKDGILGILSGLDAFLKAEKGKTANPTNENNNAFKQKNSADDTPPAENDTNISTYTDIPKELTFSNDELFAISKYQLHIKNIGKKY